MSDIVKQSDIAGFDSLDQTAIDDFKQQGFVPSIKFISGTSTECKDRKANIGDYYAFDTAMPNPIVIVCDIRRHAIFFKNGKKHSESFNPRSPIYQSIKADVDNYDYDSGHRPRESIDFLFYVPEIGEFCVYFPSSPTQRPVAGDINKYIIPLDKRTSDVARALGIKKIFTLGHKILTNYNKTPAPTAIPLDILPDGFDDPGKEALEKAIKIFFTPVIQELENPVEVASEDDADR